MFRSKTGNAAQFWAIGPTRLVSLVIFGSGAVVGEVTTERAIDTLFALTLTKALGQVGSRIRGRGRVVNRRDHGSLSESCVATSKSNVVWLREGIWVVFVTFDGL